VEEETKGKIKKSLFISLSVFIVSLVFLLVLTYVQDGFNGVSLLITAFAVVGGGIKTVKFGWLTNYITLTVMAGIIISTNVYLIASYFSKKKRIQRVEGLMLSLVNQAQNAINEGRIPGAIQTYQQLQYLYSKLPKKSKEKMHDAILGLHSKIVALQQGKPQPVQQPAAQPAQQPAAQPAQQPVQQPVQQPAAQPTQQPVQQGPTIEREE
jgi:hypothetical protein